MKPGTRAAARLATSKDTLASQVTLLEALNLEVTRNLKAANARIAELDAAVRQARREQTEAEKCAEFWRGASEASSAMESRYKATILGLGHALADLKLDEADLDSETAPRQ